MDVSINTVKIKEAMDALGIKTQTELAEKIGISKNQLSLILSEKYSPLKARFQEICDVLKISALDVLDAVEDDFNEPVIISDDTDTVTSIELFAGGGGLALGLERANIKTLLHVEIDKYCCETLKTNRPNWHVQNEDISKIDFTPYCGEVDIVSGGFPCQAFSYAGKKLGLEDTRGTLFYEFARCIKETQPVVFLAENVRGLISHDEGRTLNTILSVFKELGYNIAYKLLNAVDYGVAQKRERIIIIGTREGAEYSFPKKQAVQFTLKDALINVPKSEGQTYSDRKRAILEQVPPGGCWRDLPVETQKSYMGKSYYSGGGRTGMARRLSWDEPCLTLTCSPSQKQTERCHPDETRPFTVREYARIQTFPDDWEFSGGLTQKYKQIGNALPVKLATLLGEELKKTVIEYRKKGNL